MTEHNGKKRSVFKIQVQFHYSKISDTYYLAESVSWYSLLRS